MIGCVVRSRMDIKKHRASLCYMVKYVRLLYMVITRQHEVRGSLVFRTGTRIGTFDSKSSLDLRWWLSSYPDGNWIELCWSLMDRLRAFDFFQVSVRCQSRTKSHWFSTRGCVSPRSHSAGDPTNTPTARCSTSPRISSSTSKLLFSLRPECIWLPLYSICWLMMDDSGSILAAYRQVINTAQYNQTHNNLIPCGVRKGEQVYQIIV